MLNVTLEVQTMRRLRVWFQSIPFDLLPDVLLIPHVTGQAKTGQSANGKIYDSPFEEPQSTTGQNVRSSTKPNFSGLLQHGKS